MTRRRRQRATLPPLPSERAIVVPLQSRKAHGLGLVMGADMVARTQSLHDWMLRRGLIDQTLHDAAVRYLTDYELAHGARGGDGGGVSSAGWERTPGQAQINAITRLRRANEVLGLDVALFVRAVVHGDSLRTLAARWGGGRVGGRSGARAVARVRAGLRRLEGHYFGKAGRAEMAEGSAV